MKESSLAKIVEHPDREDIVSQLCMGISPSEIAERLKYKYRDTEGKKYIISAKLLSDFQDNYLNLYQQIRNDVALVKTQDASLQEQASDLVQTNSSYRQKLAEYADQEIDLKQHIKNLIFIMQDRVEKIYNSIQENSQNFKPDYILIQYFNNLTTAMEKANVIINGSPDQIIQQNNYNIQLVDRQLGLVHDIIRDILSKLDYETSQYFMEMWVEKISKLHEPVQEEIPVEMRLEQIKKIKEDL